MTNIKAVFFDIDGTFFDHITGRVLLESRKAAELLQKNGYKVCLCSGRTKEMSEQLGVLQMFPWDGFVGGAGVSVYNEKAELIHECCFSQKQAKQIFALGKQHTICIHSHGKYEFMTLPLNAYSQKVFEDFHCQIPIVRDWHGETMVALSAYEKKGFDWSMFAAIEGIEVQQPCDTGVDFMLKNVSKASGIRVLMDAWGFEPDAYMAFGDSINDVEMLQEARVGVAMGNATEELKSYADAVIGPSDEPSIYLYLKQQHML